MSDAIDVTTLAERRTTGLDGVILDVREHSELATASIDPDVHIPLGELPQRVEELEAHRGEVIYTLCHHGMRSARAAGFLAQHGFRTCNITGGIDAWSAAVDATVPRY